MIYRYRSYTYFLFRNRVAILEQGNEYLYEDIYMRSWDLAKGLLGTSSI
jgi:hypothetical protein